MLNAPLTRLLRSHSLPCGAALAGPWVEYEREELHV